jgi:hypothetical protein
MLPTLTKSNPENILVKDIINLHNTNLVEYEYYSFAISQENFEKLKTDYEFLNKIDISNKENSIHEIIASRSSSIQLKNEQIRILDESILNWNCIKSLLNYILINDKYWTTAWSGMFPDEQEVFLTKINELQIQDYPEELVETKNNSSKPVKNQIKQIDLSNISIESFKDILYNFFIVLNSPETIEKRSALEINYSSELPGTTAFEKFVDHRNIGKEYNDDDDNSGYHPYEGGAQKGGFIPLIVAAAWVGAHLYGGHLSQIESDKIRVLSDKIAEQQNIEAEHTIGQAVSSNIRLPVKPDYLKYQYNRILEMINTDKNCLNSIYKSEFENILKIIQDIYIPNIIELKNLYDKEIQIYKVVIESKTKELIKEIPTILKVINANREYKEQFVKYTTQLRTGDDKYATLTRYKTDYSGHQENTQKPSVIQRFMGTFGLFEGGRRITRKQKNKKQRVTRYGSRKRGY